MSWFSKKTKKEAYYELPIFYEAEGGKMFPRGLPNCNHEWRTPFGCNMEKVCIKCNRREWCLAWTSEAMDLHEKTYGEKISMKQRKFAESFEEGL